MFLHTHILLGYIYIYNHTFNIVTNTKITNIGVEATVVDEGMGTLLCSTTNGPLRYCHKVPIIGKTYP